MPSAIEARPLPGIRAQAAIYTRISRDDNDDRLGVQRQEQDLRREAERRGFAVREPVLEDDDLSGSGNVTRPAFDQLIDLIAAGEVSVVLAHDLDRLSRGWKPFVRLYEACERSGCRVVWIGGEANFATGEGLLELEIRASFAREELRKIRARVRRKAKELAETGKMSGGGTRPYGYKADRKTLCHDEAEIVREAARRVLNGEAIRALCRDFERRGIATVKGSPWTPTVLRNLLISARISGRREHGRRDPQTRSMRAAPITSTETAWAAIITPADSDALRRLLSNPARRTTSMGRTHLLGGGVARCGICGTGLVSRPSAAQRDDEGNIIRAARPGYICAKGPGFHGCGGIRISADDLESDVVERILIAVDGGALDGILDADVDTAQSDALATVSALEHELDSLATAFGAGEFSRSEWQSMRVGIDDRLRRAQRHYDELRGRSSLHKMPRPLRSAWERFDDTQKRATIRDLVAEVRVASAVRGRNKYDQARARVVWKV